MDIETDIIQPILEQLPNVMAIYQFGSTVRGEARSNSDIDLAVFLSGKDQPALWAFAQELAKSIGRDVDLVDLRRASTVMAAQIIHTGQRIYCRDRLLCENYENYRYVEYAEFNELRQGILDDIQQRGSVYG